MKTAHIHKAQPVSDPIESVTIVIDEEFPRVDAGGLQAYFASSDAQADRLHDALINALPGGVLTRLAVRLAQSQLVSGLIIRPQDIGK